MSVGLVCNDVISVSCDADRNSSPAGQKACLLARQVSALAYEASFKTLFVSIILQYFNSRLFMITQKAIISYTSIDTSIVFK